MRCDTELDRAMMKYASTGSIRRATPARYRQLRPAAKTIAITASTSTADVPRSGSFTMRNASPPVTMPIGTSEYADVVDAMHPAFEHRRGKEDRDQFGEFGRLQRQARHGDPALRAVPLLEDEDQQQAR